MDEDKERTEDEREASEGAASGPGNVSVDEPTEPALEGGDDEGFRDGVPEPGDGGDGDS